MSGQRYEVQQIGDCTLYRGDCYDLLPTLQADALITDPPYGIQFDYTKQRRGHKIGKKWGKSLYEGVPVKWTSSVRGDTESFIPQPFLQFPQVILWGANHYASRLPDSGAWLIWDKRDGMRSNDFSDCELAWSNLRGTVRLYRQLWNGLLRAGEENGKAKLHPAQKPIALMRWCVQKTVGVVLDPFAGSCTTALACVELGRPCIVVEIDPYYWELGCQRIEAAYAQLCLFPTPSLSPVQEVLL